DRLGVSEGGLCCVGTSATLGGSEDSTRLRQYAEDVFDTPFEEGAVIGETRQTAEAFLQPVRYTIFPDLEQHDALQPEAQAHPADYVAAQIPHWFPEGTGSDWDLTTDAGRIALGEALRRHLMTHSVVDLLDDRPAEISDLAARLEARLPQLKGISRRQQTAMLRSFLSVLSWARTASNSGGEARPFVQLRTQLWLREMRRMVASVDNPPVLAFHDDLPESEHDGHLPVAHCLECGAMGWVGIQRPNETTIRTGLKNIYQKFFASDPSCVFAFPVGADERVDAEGRYHQLCTHDLHLNDADADACTACDQEDGLLRVFMPHVQRTTQDDTQVSVRDCPHCGASSTLTIMGSRAASLSSVMISQLFASEYNTDKKLLTFSDSVQDAAHRAGFFESRTYRFNIRSAIQQYVDQASEPVTLDEAMRQITDHYTQTYSKEAFVSNFIAPDMRWLRDYDQMLEQGTLPDESDIVTRVRKRLSWETWSEYGFRARIGRTLEKTGASTLQVDTGRLQSAVDALVPELQNNVGDLREVAPTDVARFVRGLIAHMKNQGAIYHPELDRYIEQGGNSYMLNRQHHLPNYGYRSRLPAFVASRSTQRFDPVLTPAGNADSWLQAWATKCFGAHDPMLSSVMDQLYDRVLSILVTNNLLERRETSRGVRVWGVRPDALRVTTAVRQLRCDTCDHNASVGHDVVDDWQGTRCLRYQCTGRYASEAHAPNYYRQLYTQSARRRIIAREHTGLLEREERETLEKAFDHNEHPWDPNLISCTPTLEMGVDIGKLSTVMLCSVPPSPSNFVQRIGRGGRRTGNALDVTVANGQPHDLYFFEDPTEMIAGTIEPPGIYLNATYVLFRQFVAFCFDRWIASGEVGPQAVPGTLGRALPTLKVEGAFPDTWLSFVEMNEDELFADFIALFSDTLDEDDTSELRSVIAKEGGFRYQVMGRFESVVKRRKAIKRDVQRIRSRIRKHEEGPASNQAEEEINKLRQEKTALQRIDAQIRSMRTYNFLTESGLLPNYAFPEEGVTLRSVLLRGEEIWAKEYRRPASQALKELAPGATFYAGGRSVQVDQIDLSGEDTLQ
ncbi:MAG: helicase-related protein, partial [Longimonas sp.]|uniref:helicase-related protein n=1 Tax=Longimonas sp. TaxID=2039626 RepID=UPI00397621BF